MKANERRSEILSYLGSSKQPVSACALSAKFGVSRQVIVQDIAILRAEGNEVISTSRGYMADANNRTERVIKCRHSLDELTDEGGIIISLGGRVENIFVNHRIYGKISAALNLVTMTDAEELHRSLVSGASKPLMSVTDGYHYHTISADSEQMLDEIENKLRQKGYLIEI